MTEQELDKALRALGLKIPENECNDILNAVKFIEEMRALVRKPRSFSSEPSNIVSFPREHNDC